MNILTTLILIFFPILIFGQSKFSVGMNLSPEVTKMEIANSNASGRVSEKGKLGFGYTVGLHLRYELSETIFLRSGLNFRNLNHRHEIDGIIFNSNNITSSILNTIQISSIGVPIDIGYKISSSKENMKYIIGCSALMNINPVVEYNALLIYEQSETEELSQVYNQVNPSMFSLAIFTGIEFQVKDKYLLGIEPKVQLTPNSFTLYLYDSVGKTALEAGLTVRMSFN